MTENASLSYFAYFYYWLQMTNLSPLLLTRRAYIKGSSMSGSSCWYTLKNSGIAVRNCNVLTKFGVIPLCNIAHLSRFYRSNISGGWAENKDSRKVALFQSLSKILSKSLFVRFCHPKLYPSSGTLFSQPIKSRVRISAAAMLAAVNGNESTIIFTVPINADIARRSSPENSALLYKRL